jgi:hypothetical protein
MKNLLITICLLGVLVVLTGCTEQVSYLHRKAVFVEAEYAPYNIPGTGKVVGQTFLKTRGGDVKYGAGNIVYMNPVTSYSTEWFESIKQLTRLEDPDPRTNKYNLQTMADGEGRFEFDNLPAGEYYIMCNIFWEVPSGRHGYMKTTGNPAYSRVKVENGKTTKTIVTR